MIYWACSPGRVLRFIVHKMNLRFEIYGDIYGRQVIRPRQLLVVTFITIAPPALPTINLAHSRSILRVEKFFCGNS